MANIKSKKIGVLVVDDSGFFRRRITEILESDSCIQVLDTAIDGEDAVVKVAALRPDVVTMDIEMPVLDGIGAVRRIMEKNPTPILMFSVLTRSGAQATLDALDAGALDFLPKNFENISENRKQANDIFCERVRTLATRGTSSIENVSAGCSALNESNQHGLTARTLEASNTGKPDLIIIGTSTGGPAALQQIFSKLPEKLFVPIVVIQHMPASFTGPFSERLNNLCQLTVKEAEDGELLQSGSIYVAPGGCQLELNNRRGNCKLKIYKARKDQQYKPCVDIAFSSAAKAYGKTVLGIILTGMGSDGTDGARALKQEGSTIWAQDRESSVIYGMPMSVAEAGLVDRVLRLDDFADALIGHGLH